MKTPDGNTQGIRRGRYVEIASLIYNLAEVAVSMTAGFLSGSSALVSWGTDSLVEAVAASFMIWRLHGEECGIGERQVRWRKKVALGVLSAAFAVAVAFILYESISTLFAGTGAGFSRIGVAILVTSLVVNPVLAWLKYHYGKKTDSPSLVYDAKDTMICEYQTVVVLLGLGLSEWVGWWWADPIAALLIVPYVAWEGYDAARDAIDVDIDR